MLHTDDLSSWLEARVPDWKEREEEARREFNVPHDSPAPAYVLLSAGLRSYIEGAMERGDANELQRIGRLLEDLFEGDSLFRDALANTLEELSHLRHRLWSHLGQAARESFREDIFWLPRYGE